MFSTAYVFTFLEQLEVPLIPCFVFLQPVTNIQTPTFQIIAFLDVGYPTIEDIYQCNTKP